ncbi:hypothetical protein [Chryseobacterium sp. MP_3.2]|uniref:hypothetical protein n=1 Tax=Chryseobacterium sp. MP_3.2 TaxID=3071712 RepID=UPI002E05301E|nr:hypothetical protein [Chryseobacterium sp. MP_3.2]
MDLQTRTLNLISFLAQLQDENFIVKIEDFILSKSGKDIYFKPFTEEELIVRIQKSEEDFKIGKYITQNELEEISSKW